MTTMNSAISHGSERGGPRPVAARRAADLRGASARAHGRRAGGTVARRAAAPHAGGGARQATSSEQRRG